MSTSSQAVAQQASPPAAPAPSSVKGIVDMLLAQQMMSILQGRGPIRTISWQQISEIIVVMSLDEVKSALMAAATTIKQLLMTNHGTVWEKCVSAAGSVWGAIRYVLYGWLLTFWARRRPSLIPQETNTTPVHVAQITTQINVVLEKIITELHKIPSSEHSETQGYTVNSNIQWNVKNLEETILTETWSNIRFSISPDIMCEIQSTIEVSWNIRRGKKTLSKINRHETKSGTIYTLLPTWYRSFTSQRPGTLYKMSHWTDIVSSELKKITTVGEDTPFTSTDVGQYAFHINIFSTEPRSFVCLLCLDAYVDDDGDFLESERMRVYPVRWGTLFGLTYDDDSVQYSYKSGCSELAYYKLPKSVVSKYIDQFRTSFDKTALKQLCLHLAYARKKQHIAFKPIENGILLGESGPFLMKLTSKTVTPDDMIKEFYTYGEKIVGDSTKPSGSQEKQKIYTVMRLRSENIKSVENPKYKEWLENLEMIKTTFGSKKVTEGGSASDVSLTPQLIRSIGTPPSKTIEEITRTTTIESKEMNEAYKPFDTLYVRGEDHARIKSSLQMFRDRQELLISLGLPNKYGLLLTGPPGTGKTSTIYAVATELQKPIYYVQLSRELTCGDLRLMFEHVYKIKGGGIVVFEDIDSMTDIVLARSEKATEQSSILNISNSENVPLTLSYFLNFLDGALTQTGSVVIATTNHPERLDPAFKRPGRFDLTVELGNANHGQIRAIYKRMMGREPEAAVLARVQENVHSPAAIIFRIKDYMLDMAATDEFILEPFFGLEIPVLDSDESAPMLLKKDETLLAELRASRTLRT